MLKFLGFVMGLLGFLVAIAGAVALYFFIYAPSVEVKPVAQAPGVEAPVKRPEKLKPLAITDPVFVEATIHVPELLMPMTRSGIRIMSLMWKMEKYAGAPSREWATANIEQNSDPSAPFPRKVRLEFDRQQLTRIFSGPKGSVLIAIDGCNATKDPNCLQPKAMRLSFRGVKKRANQEFAKGEVIQLGDVFFNRASPLGQEIDSINCQTSTPSMTGKIFYTSEFLEKAPKGKRLALAIGPSKISRTLEENYLRKLPEHPSSLMYVTQFIQPSPEGNFFSFPTASVKVPDYLAGYVMLCSEGEDLNTCVDKHFPVGYSPVSDDGKGFQLVSEKLLLHHCSEAGPANFIAHWFPPLKEGEKPILGNTRNPKLPPEIIEGQNF